MFKTIMCLACLLFSAVSGMSQISISSNDYFPLVGTEEKHFFDIAMDETFFNTVSAGSGGPLTWDFSSRPYGSGFTEYSFDPLNTPAIDQFPDGNLVMMSKVGIDTSWIVYESTPAVFTELGSVYHGSGAEITVKYEDNTDDYSFPLNYNDQWTAYRHWTQNSSHSYTLNFDTSIYIVDAWGTAQYQTNSFPCLRIRQERRFTFKTYDLTNQLLDSTTQYTTTILFVGDGFSQLVGVSRVSFLTILNYSGSASEEFTNTTSGVELVDNDIIPNNFALSQNYPNPFNPSTKIDFTIPNKAHVRLDIYNLLGREVATLINSKLAAGNYVVDWDGRDNKGVNVASGIYFYRMASDDYSESKKMILLK